MKFARAIIISILMALCVSPANAQKSPVNLPPPRAIPALDGIFAAFKTHPLVGMLNHEGRTNHDLAQQQDLYAAIIRDPRFAHDVRNVVVEVGASSAQAVLNRYVNGEDVPYIELRKVWTDTLGWVPPPINLGYVNLFAQIRATNLTLLPSQRIHVWLGEPPVEWSRIKSQKDLVPSGTDVLQFRDNFAAALIERQILSKGHKALVIYGGYHFLTDQVLIGGVRPPGTTTMAQQLEKRHPGAIFKVTTYVGYFENSTCTNEFEKGEAGFKLPVLLEPLHGTALDDPSFLKRCPVAGVGSPPNLPPEKQPEFKAHAVLNVAGLNADAMLYLGPSSSLTASPIMPDAYLDAGYLNEIMRRMKIMYPKATPSILGITVDKNPASPLPFVH